jgi:hypothetical protein
LLVVLLTWCARGFEGAVGLVEVGFTAFGGVRRMVVRPKMELRI